MCYRILLVGARGVTCDHKEIDRHLQISVEPAVHNVYGHVSVSGCVDVDHLFRVAQGPL